MTQQLSFLDPVENQIGKKENGNDRMVNYGIQNESSDYRVHVGYLTQHIYIFPTSEGKKSLDKAVQAGMKKKEATQPGVSHSTAQGYAIPISHIGGLEEVLIPQDLYIANPITRYDSTSIKGMRALNIVVGMLKRNLIRLPLNIDIIDDKDLQIKGGDITIHSKLILQVKCDMRGGNRKFSPQATGNLFLQVAECNPRGLY